MTGREKCQARIWPSWASAWITCNQPIVNGECARYGHKPEPESEPDVVAAAPSPFNQQRAAEEPPWGDDVAFGETCRRDAKLRDDLAGVIADWMAAPNPPEDWQRNNADDLTADLLPYVHAYKAQAEARGRAEGLEQGRGDLEAWQRTCRAEGRAEAAAKIVTLAERWDEMARDHDEQGASTTAIVYRAHAQLVRRAVAADLTAPADRSAS